MAKASQKEQDYAAAMERQTGDRSAISGYADPFSDYALSDFGNECDILETLGKAWKMSFCQATMGFSRRPGGLWIAYTPDRAPKSVLHVERFVGKSTDHATINFWSSDVLQGKLYAGAYKLPFVIIMAFEDGLFALNTSADPWEPTERIGERVRKGKAFEGTVNMVTYVDVDNFRKLGGKRESADK